MGGFIFGRGGGGDWGVISPLKESPDDCCSADGGARVIDDRNPLKESSNDCCSEDSGARVFDDGVMVRVRTSPLSLISSRSSPVSR